jgi:putative FmdB family regulatory protein
MPIYEYRCSTCGFQKEYLQKVSDPRPTECPECGKPTFDKMLTAAGFQLKGSGWYVTDFRDNGSSKPKAEKGKTDKVETAKSETDKSETDKVSTSAAEPKKEEKKSDAAASTPAATPAST